MNFFGKILKSRRLLGTDYYHLGQNSATDWLIIVGIFTSLLVIFVVLAFYQFSNYHKSDAVVERSMAATSTVVLFNRAKLDELVKYFAVREQKFNKIKTTPLRFVDPSR